MAAAIKNHSDNSRGQWKNNSVLNNLTVAKCTSSWQAWIKQASMPPPGLVTCIAPPTQEQKMRNNCRFLRLPAGTRPTYTGGLFCGAGPYGGASGRATTNHFWSNGN